MKDAEVECDATSSGTPGRHPPLGLGKATREQPAHALGENSCVFV